MQSKFLSSEGMPTWESLSNAGHKECNKVLMSWVEWAFQEDLTYNQAVEGVLSFAEEHFGVCLKPTWRLLRSWRDREPVELRHPLSMAMLKSLVCVCLFWKWDTLGLLFWLGFHALLRPGEIQALSPWDFAFHSR